MNDLRKKVSPVIRLGESLRRFRLVFVLVLIGFLGFFGRDAATFLTYASDCGVALSNLDSDFLFANRASVLSFACVVLLVFILRFWLGGPWSGVSLAVSLPLFSGILVGSGFLGGDAYILWGGLAVCAFIAFAALRAAFCKAFLPAFLALYLWCAICSAAHLPFGSFAGFAVLPLADLLAVSLIAGRELSKGTPVFGAILAGFSKVFFPMLASNVLFGLWAGFQFHSQEPIAWAICSPVVSAALYLLAEFPLLTFAPLEKMRASQRTMELRHGKGA